MRRFASLVATLTLALASPLAAFGADITGKVVRVIDGDTFVLLVENTDGTKHQQRIRITSIDCPEETQAYYQVAKDHLGQLIHEHVVKIETKNTDIHGRTVAKVVLDGKDVGLEQVRAGLAWYARAYASALSLEEQGWYLSAESAARRQREGLWTDANPTPPWAFRKVHKRESR
jgi:endonuclease YncB( thermonuclease family)